MKQSTNVDFVLVRDSSESSSTAPSSTAARAAFEANLRREGLSLLQEEPSSNLQLAHLHFTTIRAPLDVLRCYAEILRIRLPMKRPPPASACASGFDEFVEFETESLQDQRRHQRTSAWCSWRQFKSRYLELNPATIPSGSQFHIYSDNNGNGGSQPPKLSAVYSRDREYLFALEELNEYAFFTPSIRYRIVDFILKRTHFSDSDSEFGIERLLKDGVYCAAYPLHDGGLDDVSSIRHLLFEEWAAVSRCFKYQPLQIIRDYFGVKIGMYFAWLGFYTAMLVPIAVLGFICFLYGVATMSQNVHITDICRGAVQEPMCPLCDRHCNYWNLTDTCFYAKLTHLFDNESTFLFSIVISLWTVIFLECWKRYSATLCHQWDLGGTEAAASDQHPRPEYLRRLRNVNRTRIDAVTRRAEPRVSFWRHVVPNVALSLSISWLLISLAVVAIVGVILYRISLKVLVLSEGRGSYGLLLVNVSAVLVNLVFILGFNHLYSRLAEWLTEIELHRTQIEFDESLSLKIYLLQFVNFYAAPFYIAFFKGKFAGSPEEGYATLWGFRNEECSPGGCMSELCIQLAIIMVGKQALNAVVEMSSPVIKKWVKNCGRSAPGPVDKTKGAKSQILSKQQQWAEDYQLLEWDSRSLFPEYLEMVLQFGFITIFISAFPLGPLFALVNNIFEMRLDGKKMLQHYRRPVSQRIAGDIGIWSTVLDTISKLAVVSNAFILGFTSDFIPKLIYRLEYGSLDGYLQYSLAFFNTSGFEERSRPDPSLGSGVYANVSVCRYESFGKSRPEDGGEGVDDLYWKVWLARFIFVVCFQNFVFSCLVVLEWMIPDVPKELADQIRQEEYLTNEIIIKNEVGRTRGRQFGSKFSVNSSQIGTPSPRPFLEPQTSIRVLNEPQMEEIGGLTDKISSSSSGHSSASELNTRL